MKKIGIIFVMAFMVFGMFSIVSAEELEIEDAGRVPGNAFYGLDQMFDNLRVSMTINQERKAEKALLVAEERLAEIEKLTEDGEIEKAEKARESYEKFIERSENAIKRIESNGDVNKSEEALRRVSRVQESLEAHHEKLKEIHLRIIEARGDNMTEEELAKIDEIFAALQEKSELIGQRTVNKLTNLETQHKVLADLSDEDLEELLIRIQGEEGIDVMKKDREARDDVRFSREVEAREGNLERFKERIENSNLTDEEKAKALERVNREEMKVQEFKENKEALRERLQDKEHYAEELREQLKNRIENAKKGKFDKLESADEVDDEDLAEDEPEDEFEDESDDESEDNSTETNSTEVN